MEGQVPRLPTTPPLRHQVHQVLEDLIVDRVLEPGTRLGEAELASQLGVSRNPVREALVTLQQDGWIEVRHRQGAYVRVPSPREVEETFVVREALETKAAMMAAERITSDQLEQLAQLLEEGDAASASGEASLLVDYNARFHRVVFEAADNGVLAEMLRQLDKRIRWYFAAIAVRRAAESWQEHAEISRHLRARDPEAVAEVMVRHIAATREAYRQEVALHDGAKR